MPKRTFQPDTKKLDALRIKRGWTVDDLAQKACCSTRTINSIMLGNEVVISTVRKLAKALDVSVESLLVGYSPEPPIDDTLERRIEVQLKLSIPFAQFDETEHLSTFIQALTQLIGAKGVVNIANVKDGSTIITVEVTEYDMKSIYGAFLAGKLEPLSVSAILSPDITSLEQFTRMQIDSIRRNFLFPNVEPKHKPDPRRKSRLFDLPNDDATESGSTEDASDE